MTSEPGETARGVLRLYFPIIGFKYSSKQLGLQCLPESRSFDRVVPGFLFFGAA